MTSLGTPPHRCIICNTVTPEDLRSAELGTKDGDLLSRQVSVIYLVNKLLEISTEICSTYLKKFGNPENWTKLCSECDSIVVEGQRLFLEIKKLETKHLKIKSRVKLRMNLKQEVENEEDGYSETATCEIRQLINGRSDEEEPVHYEDSYFVVSSTESLSDNESEKGKRRKQPRRSARNISIRPLGEIIDSPNSEDDENAIGLDEDFLMAPEAQTDSSDSENEDIKPNSEVNESKSNPQPKTSIEKKRKKSMHQSKTYEKLTFQEVVEMRNKLLEQMPFEKNMSSEDLKKRKSVLAANSIGILCSRHKVTEFHCSICSQIFCSYKDLRQHGLVSLCQENDEKSFIPVIVEALRCEICSKPVDGLTALEDHHRIFHLDKDVFKCRGCSVVFRRIKQFQQHYEDSLKSNPSSECVSKVVFCHFLDACPRLIRSSKEALELHTKLHHKDPIRNFLKCNFLKCSKTFGSMRSLKSHVERHRYTELKCTYDQCAAIFGTKPNLKKHIKLCHLAKQEGAPRYPCTRPSCDKTFLSKYRLTMHERTHTSETPHLCGVCGRSYKSRDYLTVHMYIHDPEKRKKFAMYRQNQRDKGWVRKTKYVKKKKYYYKRKPKQPVLKEEEKTCQ